MPTLSHCSLSNSWASCNRNLVIFVREHFKSWHSYSWEIPQHCLSKVTEEARNFFFCPHSHDIWLHVNCSIRACVAVDVRVSFVGILAFRKMFWKCSGQKCMQPVYTSFPLDHLRRLYFVLNKMSFMQRTDECPSLVDATMPRDSEKGTFTSHVTISVRASVLLSSDSLALPMNPIWRNLATSP